MQMRHLAPVCLAILSSASAFESFESPSQDLRSLLYRRDETSCKAVDSRLPDAFKCPTGSNCLSLDDGTSGLCCPDQNTCNNIALIPCDIQQQNITRFPDANIFTTRLGDQLPACGDQCCPFGYSCLEAPKNQDSKPVCSLNTSKSASSAVSSTSSGSSSGASTSKTSTSASKTATSTSTSTAISGASTNAAQLEECNKFPATVFLAGLFPGMFVGAFLMLAWVICTGRHRKPPQRNSSSSSVYKPHISDPIPMHAGGRTEFLRRTTGRARSMFSTRSGQSSTAGTRENWKMPTPPANNNIPPVPPGVPVTPERRMARDSGTESIKVYSPPSGPSNQPAMPAYPPNIAPLRGMNAQRYLDQNNNYNGNTNNAMGSPFETPPHANKSGANNIHSNTTGGAKGERTLSSYSRVSSLHEPEVLTPARYDGNGYVPAQQRTKAGNGEEKSRPNTTFTEMLHEVGFPDNYQDTPKVPKIPNGYGGR